MNKFLSAAIAALALSASTLTVDAQEAKNAGSFTIGNQAFLLNNEPFVIKAAEIHYPRIPREYWDHRIKMCKSLGMNTICIYVFWNIHEQTPGEFDFTGNNDIAEFCRLAQENDMYIIVRPGPYVCAEWEMGGLPWWLLKKKDIRLREDDPYFMERVAIFEEKVAEQLADLTIAKGGNIIMVQVENEYGSYGENKKYIEQTRDIIRKNFPDVELFQCDWSSNFTRNGLDDLVWTMNFGTGANIDEQFKKLKELRPESPLMCSEFWSGWFDNWGRKHETRDAKAMVDGLREMLDKNISFSLYMAHGGTTFGHWGGANSPGFSPMCTSYDYDAPINEAGQVTPKFWELRKMMKNFMPKGEQQAKVPAAIPTITFPEVKFTQVAPLFENLPEAKTSYDIKTMEEFDQGWGSILYRTTLPEINGQSKLAVLDAHDWAQVFIDGKKVGTLYRKNGEKELVLPSVRKGAQLDILVEAMGRINFGRAIKDFKGISDRVELTIDIEGRAFTSNLKNWEVYNLPCTYEFTSEKDFKEMKDATVPGFYRATFNLKKTGDTFINMESWGKGMVWVNGKSMGRFWEVGPQHTLYMPGCWLKEGENEIIVLDVKGPEKASVEGLKKPIIDLLRLDVPATHRKDGENLDLSSVAVAHKGAFDAGNGWQEVKFNSTQNGRFFCLEALSTQKPEDVVAIAELYILDENGQRISREPWTVRYANSEENKKGNRTGDKVFDLQESTYWCTVDGTAFPHHLVIDLGKETKISGFQYLPRMEQNAPGSIRDYNVYIENQFKY